MVDLSTQSVRRAVSRIIFYQFLIVVGLALMLFLVKGTRSSLSFFGGGLAYVLPTLIFTRVVLLCAGAAFSARFMIAFFAGEAFKLVLSGALFLLVVLYCHASTIEAVGGLLGAILAFWGASALCLLRQGV